MSISVRTDAALPGFTDLTAEQLEQLGGLVTAEEIAQQPRLWRVTVEKTAARRAETNRFLSPVLENPDVRIVFTGAGTSALIGEVLAGPLRRRLSREVDAVPTTDIVSNPRDAFADDVPTLLVSFGRSEDSPESLWATELADALVANVRHLMITSNPDGELARAHADRPDALVLVTPPGSNDRGFAMTSSFTCMLLTALLALAPQDGDVQLVESVAQAGEEVLAEWSDRLATLAGRGYKRVVYLGSGPLTGLARVSADKYTQRYDEDISAELRTALGPEHVLVVDSTETGWFSDDEVPDELLALPYVLVAQLLAMRTSLARGRTPNNPFPSGEVNRVVQGVTIHPFG